MDYTHNERYDVLYFLCLRGIVDSGWEPKDVTRMNYDLEEG